MRRTPALFALLLAVPAQAQEAPAATPAPPADIAFTEVDRRLTVPVSIAGQGPYRFLIDTGAERTVVSRELADALALPPGPPVRVTAMTGSAPARTVLLPSVGVTLPPGAPPDAVPAIGGRTIEAPAFLRAFIDADGMLGLDTLQGRALAIDFDAKTMAVTPAVRHRRRTPATPDEIVVVAKSMFGQLVVTDAWVGATRVRVVLDTGSMVSLGNLALRRRLGDRHPATPIRLWSVLGQEMSADYAQVNGVQIGGLRLDALPIAWADAAPFARFGLADRPAIMLGMDALSLFRRVEIDFANRELRLTLPREVAEQRRRMREF